MTQNSWAAEEFVTVDSCRLRLLAAGNGPPLLYLHGAGGPAPWSPFFVELAKSFRVIAPDHPGFGRSGEPSWLAGIDDLAYFYLDFLAAQGLDRVHLVGHSMGGWIAMEAAVRSTARLKSLTLLDPAGIYVKGHPMADIFITPPAEILGKLLYVDKGLAEQALAELASPKTEAEIDALIRNRTSAALLCWQPRLYNPKLAKWLHRIDVPTHLVWGDSDRIIPPAYAETLRAAIPAARLTMIERCGHVPQVERAEATLAAVTGFLKGCAP